MVEASRQEIDDADDGSTTNVNLLDRRCFHDATHLGCINIAVEFCLWLRPKDVRIESERLHHNLIFTKANRVGIFGSH